MTMGARDVAPHLTDAELFGLAAPPVGEPEPLPGHLSECFHCSRALQEWKLAMREAAAQETEELDRRSPAQWEALENGTVEALRRAGRSRRPAAVKWAVSIAASLLLVILLLPSTRKAGREAPETAVASFSVQDQNDDTLLRDVARLSRDDDAGSWDTLAPEPGTTGREEEQL
jgi:hypothetical protein